MIAARVRSARPARRWQAGALAVLLAAAAGCGPAPAPQDVAGGAPDAAGTATDRSPAGSAAPAAPAATSAAVDGHDGDSGGGPSGAASLPRYPATAPAIAAANLDFTIERRRAALQQLPNDPGITAQLVDALLLRARYTHRFADLDEALAAAGATHAADPAAPLARQALARVLATLHRFDEAAALLEGADPDDPLGTSTGHAIAMARGAVPAAVLDAARAAAQARPGWPAWIELGLLLGASGARDEADAAFAAALAAYTDVSPHAYAWAQYQRAELWREADPARAIALYREALHYLPDYVTARVHLAETLAGQGDRDAAIELLQGTAALADDPDIAAVLAAQLVAAGRPADAQPWIARAAAGFDALLARHERAFADHAAEFYAGVGNDPARAARLRALDDANRTPGVSRR